MSKYIKITEIIQNSRNEQIITYTSGKRIFFYIKKKYKMLMQKYVEIAVKIDSLKIRTYI